jgi:peptidoglycan-associated lipoprotein
MRRSFVRLAVLVSALALVGFACSKGPKDGKGMTGGESEFDDGSGVTGRDVGEPERVPELSSVYFDYDRSDIRADARPTLKSNAQAIQSHSEWRSITLEGHCDERGSEEYNLALGERRATAAKRYLVDLGVPATKLVTVSFGESTPAVQGHDESAWRWNRRVEFRVSR